MLIDVFQCSGAANPTLLISVINPDLFAPSLEGGGVGGAGGNKRRRAGKDFLFCVSTPPPYFVYLRGWGGQVSKDPFVFHSEMEHRSGAAEV